MAVQFVQRVQERVGQSVSLAEILTAMQKISAKKLSLERVVTKVQEQQNRMSIEAFVNAVYRYADRREATRWRILQAARQLDQDNVLLTPALVAGAVHELFLS
jgi:3-methyladenine DNA glycosylase AlkC